MSTYEKNETNTHNEENTRAKKSLASSSNGFIIICLIAALFGCLLFSSIFDIDTIVIEGNETLDASTIRMYSKLHTGENILKADTDGAAKNIMTNPWIDEVKVTRVFPDTVKILVTESKKCAYIKFASNAIAIDKSGKILEIIPLNQANDFPVISGITLSDTSLGAIISSDTEEEACRIMLTLVSKLPTNSVTKEITSITIDKYQNTDLLLKNGMTVHLGKGDIEYKMAFLEAAYPENFANKEGGVFDMSDPDNQPILIG